MSERFILTLHPLPHPVPVDIRLRRLLKVSLRHFGLRAVDVREVSIPCKPATRQQKAIAR